MSKTDIIIKNVDSKYARYLKGHLAKEHPNTRNHIIIKK